MDHLFAGSMCSPIGTVIVCARARGVSYIGFDDGDIPDEVSALPCGGAVEDAIRQLREYFNGDRRVFDMQLDLKGTRFQLDCWRALLAVPFGSTASYKDIAIRAGRPNAFRAVGGANHVNPICIAVPCHRIIGTDGSLVGYGGGVWRKRWLLEHERKRCMR